MIEDTTADRMSEATTMPTVGDFLGPERASATDSRLERGLHTYAKILAIPETEVSTALAARVGQAFAVEVIQSNGGTAWNHPPLRERDRIVAIVTALVCEGVYGERLENYVRLGVKEGLDEEALSALLEILAGYIGYPRAGLAMETIHGLFARLEDDRD